MEPLMQALAAADSTVREGLNAQIQALANEWVALEAEWAQVAADRARVDEGRRAMDAMVEAGRKMHRARLAEIHAREEALDSVMREMEEERQATLVATSALDEVLGDIRLQNKAHAEDLAQRVDASHGVIDMTLAQERQASEVDALLRVREEALEANGKALDERASDLERRARSIQEFEAAICWRIEVLDRTHREQEELDERA